MKAKAAATRTVHQPGPQKQLHWQIGGRGQSAHVISPEKVTNPKDSKEPSMHSCEVPVQCSRQFCQELRI